MSLKKKIIQNKKKESSHPYGIEYKKDNKGIYNYINCRDYWTIPRLSGLSKERTGYPTQKPLKLLERIIQASSDEGDIILDPFCGCATTCIAGRKIE